MSVDTFRSALEACYKQMLPGCIVVSMPPQPAEACQAEPTPSPEEDQSFALPTSTGVPIQGGTRFVAQTFTAGMTGLLTAVSVDVQSSCSNPLHVSVHGVTCGQPNANLLGERYLWSASLEPISSVPLTLPIDLGMDIHVRAGTQYAIVVDYGGCGCPESTDGYWTGATGAALPGRAAFCTTDSTFQAWQPAGSPDLGLHFRTLILPAVPVPELGVARLSGAQFTRISEIFTESYRVQNLGDQPFHNVVFSVGGAEQFDQVEVDGKPGCMSHPFSLSPGESRIINVRLQVTVPAPAEPRDRAPFTSRTSPLISPELRLVRSTDSDDLESRTHPIWMRRTTLLP